MHLKVNKKLDLKIPEFICDSGLDENLNKYEMLKYVNSFTFDIFIGKPGSGKTSLLISFLTAKNKNNIYRKVFNNVLVVMPASSRASMKNNIFKKHHEDKMFDELNGSTMNHIMTLLQDYTEANEKTLLILDDVGASLKNSDIQREIRKLIYNRRHLKTKIIMLVQSYTSIPKEIRKLVTNAFMFKPSKTEMEYFMEELFENHKHMALDIMNYSFNEPHDWIMLNVDSQRIFKNFDEIIYKKENDI